MRQKVAYIKEVAWMLAVKRDYDFSGIEIRERHHAHFRKPKRFLDGTTDGKQFRFIHATAQDRRNLDLGLNAAHPDQ